MLLFVSEGIHFNLLSLMDQLNPYLLTLAKIHCYRSISTTSWYGGVGGGVWCHVTPNPSYHACTIIEEATSRCHSSTLPAIKRELA